MYNYLYMQYDNISGNTISIHNQLIFNVWSADMSTVLVIPESV